MKSTRLLLLGLGFAALAVAAIGTSTLKDVFDRQTGRTAVAVVESQQSLPRRLAAHRLKRDNPVFLRIFKEESALELWMEGDAGWQLFQSYPICRWSGRLGPKLREGDRQAPEGFYSVDASQLNPFSRHHLALNLGFPNRFDQAHGRTGSFLMIHGGCRSIGCYAMTDAAVDDIYRLVEAALGGGQRRVDVHIFPFRLNEANLRRHAKSRWMAFWRSLKPGYDAFERGRVPTIKVIGKTYFMASEAGRDIRKGG
jgi:murein L,D-transpeptidase YafK